MNEKYIQALIIGLFIGAAIILDDFIEPSKNSHKKVMFLDAEEVSSVDEFKWIDKNDKKIAIKIEKLGSNDYDDVQKIIDDVLESISDDLEIEEITSKVNNLSESLEGLDVEVRVELKKEDN